MASDPKSVTVLSRRDHDEAMRIAAGLTIFGHQVRLVFMHRPLSESEMASSHIELLEMCDIEPQTTVSELAGDLVLLDAGRLGEAIAKADMVINI